MSSKTWAALAVALILPFLNACGDDTANQGEVRIVNATTDYATLDLSTEDSDGNDNSVVSGTAANSVSGYAGVDKGSYTFDIGSGSGATAAATVTGTVSKSDRYTVVAYLTGNSLQATFLSDNEDNPTSGKAKLRIFNAADTEAGGLDVYLTSHDCTALTVTDAAIATDVTGLQTTFTQVTAASAGTAWNVCVTATGDPSDLRLDVPALLLKDQDIDTLILTRTSGGVLLNGSVLQQQGTLTAYANAIARIRLAADAATTGLVSATVNGVSLGADSSSPSVSQYFTIASGALTAAVQINDTALSGVTLADATAGADYTLLVAGTVAAPSVTLIPDDNTPSTSTTLPVKVRVINGLNGVTGTVSSNVDSKLVGSNVSFAAASSYATIAATTGTSTVRVTAGSTVETPLTDQSFASGSVYTIFVYGDATAPQIAISQDR